MADLRDKFFSSKNRRRVVITLELDGNTEKIELRQPSFAQSEAIAEAGKNPNPTRGGLKAAALVAYHCAYDPETGAKLFKPKDDGLLYEDENVAHLIREIAEKASSLFVPPSTPECPACSKSVNAGAKFCEHCGNALPGPDEVVAKNSKTTPA